MKKKYSKTGFGFVIGCLISLFMPWLLTRPSSIFDFTKTGQIGDTIGGIMTPFIAIIAGYLTFKAFWVQYKFNKRQKKDITRERFENRFYHLMEIYQAKVNNINYINEIEGQQSFRYMFYELKNIILSCKEIYTPLDFGNIYLYLSCEIFMSGLFKNHPNEKIKKRIIRNLQNLKNSKLDNSMFENGIQQLNTYKIDEKCIDTLIPYVIFKRNEKHIYEIPKSILEKRTTTFAGYLSQLRPYLNHVYFMLCYLEDNNKKKGLEKTVQECKDMLKAQFTVHEVAIIDIFIHGEINYIDKDNKNRITPKHITDILEFHMYKYNDTFNWRSPLFGVPSN